jgi:hypothetical protein
LLRYLHCLAYSWCALPLRGVWRLRRVRGLPRRERTLPPDGEDLEVREEQANREHSPLAHATPEQAVAAASPFDKKEHGYCEHDHSQCPEMIL